MKILVNSGNIGDSAIDSLVSSGEKVRVAVRTIRENPVWQRAGVEQVVFDFAKPDTLKKAFEGIDTYVSISPLIEDLVETSGMAFEFAKNAGVKKIVRSSAMGASEKAQIDLGKWHGQAETSLKGLGIAYSIIQPASFMQNYLMYKDSIKTEGKFYAPLGDGKASLVDVREVGRAMALLARSQEHNGKTFVATGSESVSCSDIANIFSETFKYPVKFVDIPESAAAESMKKMGMPAWLIKCLSELNQVTKAGYVAGVSPDLKQLLGKSTTMREFAVDYAKVFQK